METEDERLGCHAVLRRGYGKVYRKLSGGREKYRRTEKLMNGRGYQDSETSPKEPS
jgi:hypothetical protein